MKNTEIKRYTKWHLLLAVLLTAVVTVGGLGLWAWLTLGSNGLTLLYSYQLICSNFVGEYDPDEVVDSAVSGMVSALGDRWSYYLDPESYAAEQERRANAYVGIGITVDQSREEGLYIRSVNENGPAKAAGLQAGEIITGVDGVSIAGDKRADGADLIRGEEGSQVELTVLGTDGTSRTVTVTRASVTEEAVSYELLSGGVGYIRIENFFTGSADGMIEAMDALLDEGAGALVFDVRSNGGGYLNELTPMLDRLLPEGVIFRTVSHTGAEEETVSDAECVEVPMAVLVNADTYSAAEIFAGELQEAAGAVVVGEATSGKGYAQQTFALPNGGGLGISTMEYFTGQGVSLIGSGLTLDVELSLDEASQAAFDAGTLDKAQDVQLQAALDALGQ